MKILLAIDGSPFSETSVHEVAQRPWPTGSEVKVLTVVHPWPLVPDPFLFMVAANWETLEKGRKRAPDIVAKAAMEVSEAHPQLQVTTEILEGSPKHLIVEKAKQWGADLIVMGSHGRGAAGRFLLGSVAQAVVLHAPCSVEIVHSHELSAESD